MGHETTTTAEAPPAAAGPDLGSDTTATAEPRNIRPVSTAALRLALQDDGWRSLSTASDPRSGKGGKGGTITIAHFPQFAALGVPTAMIKRGQVDPPAGAGFVETYQSTGTGWIPSA